MGGSCIGWGVHGAIHLTIAPFFLPSVVKLASWLHRLLISLSLSREFLMARQNRRDIFDPNQVGAFHAVQRTVDVRGFVA